MRVAVTLVDPARDTRNDLLLDADDTTPTRALLDGLSQTLGSLDRKPRHLYLAGRRLDPRRPISESGIRHGSLIAVDHPRASVLAEPEGILDVGVVNGPGAGALHRLWMGAATIGSDPRCVITLDDPRVPPVCVAMTVAHDGTVTVRPVEDAATLLAGTVPHADPALAMEREPLGSGDTAWPVGGQLTIGEIRLELAGVTEPDAAVEDGPEPGWCSYSRPPRLLPPDRQTQFGLPTPPGAQQQRGIPWVMVLMPVLVAVVMTLVFRRWSMLTMALFSPMMMLGNHLQSKKLGRLTHREQLADYQDRKTRIEADVAQAVVDERHARRLEAPDPALVLLIASGPRMRLWERRTSDPDYLCLRIGVGDLVSEVSVTDPEQLEHRRRTMRTAYDVPVTIPLAECGVVGIAGTGDLPRRLARWAVAQLAVLQSPRDTQVYVLTDPAGAPAWDWLRWLPHAQPQLGQDTVVTLGVDAETCARRVAELSRILAARQQAVADKHSARGPDIVVVLDGARRLRSLPGVVALLKQGPALGIYSLGLDTDERRLPEEANSVVLRTPRGLTLRRQKVTVVEDITPDLVAGPWLNRVARMLAPIRDISGDSDPVLPSVCRLTEVMGLEPVSPEVVARRWAGRPRSTEAMVGISLDGPFSFDLVKDGPHGLVAGTTGSGKSELLQSVVASLAVANRPDEMTFVLVDYKGGAAFKDCADLPHTVGMVTDLDSHLVRRALVSLGAELIRREHLLALAGAKDIEDYTDARAGQSLQALPRLLIVIDEFASLARELPDFVSGLVDIAQRGRSLGIHLILATQRPGGVVSPEIRANTNLRIALRVTDTAESSAVIDAPDAGLIARSTPGRAYVRLGARSLVPFQSGRVGVRRSDAAATPGKPWLCEIGLDQLARTIPSKPMAEPVPDAEVTDLMVIVESVVQAAVSLDLPAQHSPWLPALTTDVQLHDLLATVVAPPAPGIAGVPYAVEDLPAQQGRRAAVIDFDTFSHLSIMGGPRSGRSQALRTIAASVARLTSPADVHLYGLDCGNGALLPVESLPHCGAVVQRTQTERATRLLSRLTCELARRQEALADGGYADLSELRAGVAESVRLPHLVLLLDRWEGFLGGIAEADGGKPFEQIQLMLREGASVGLHLVLAGDRQVCSTRLGGLVEHKIGLRVPDKDDYGLIGLFPKKLPDAIPEGRGFRCDSAVELQFALLDGDPSGPAQAATLRRIGRQENVRRAGVPQSVRPFRVDVLPGRVSFEDAWKLRGDSEVRPLWAMVGVGGDELAAVGLDLSRSSCAVIAGPPRTGRSTTLLCAVESLRRGGAAIVIAAPRPSPLRGLAGQPGIRHVFTDVDVTREALEPLLDPASGPVVLVVDDGELLKDVAAKDYLREVLRTGTDHGRAILLGGDSSEVCSGFAGWQVDARGGQGVLISPRSVTDGELIGVRIPRSATDEVGRPGRVVCHPGDGTLRTLQVPLVNPC